MVRSSNICWHLNVYYWRGEWFTDKCLNFGSRSAPFIYEAVASACEWATQRELDQRLGVGVAFCRHFMDDFICIAGTAALEAKATAIMIEVMDDLQIPRADDKEQLHVQAGEFLGLWLDTGKQVVDCPNDKRAELRAILLDIRNPTTATVEPKTLQRLVGKVTWLHLVFPHSRPWVTPWLRCLQRHPRPYFRPSITTDMRAAAEHWLETLKSSRPRSFATRPQMLTAQALCSGGSSCGRWWKDDEGCWQCTVDPNERYDWWRDGPRSLGSSWLAGDAAGELGWGIFGPISVRYGKWSPSEKASFTLNADSTNEDTGKVSSTLQEVRCLRFAVEYWVTTEPDDNSVLTYFTDANNAVYLLKKMRSNKEPVNSELKLIADLCRPLRLHVRVCWHSRSSLAGRMADALSRADLQEFRTLDPKHPALRLPTRRSTPTVG
jgi:hypothetical protein